MTALADLLERVEKAEGPMSNRDIEECIRLSPWYETRHPGDPIWSDFSRTLQGSLDAALALVERVLPGWGLTLQITARGSVSCGVGKSEDTLVYAVAPTPALALLAALLKAKLAEEG